jgi:hypothetical protein
MDNQRMFDAFMGGWKDAIEGESQVRTPRLEPVAAVADDPPRPRSPVLAAVDMRDATQEEVDAVANLNGQTIARYEDAVAEYERTIFTLQGLRTMAADAAARNGALIEAYRAGRKSGASILYRVRIEAANRYGHVLGA